MKAATFFRSLAVPLFVAVTTAQPAVTAGDYAGYYQCQGRSFAFSFTVKATQKDDVEGEAVFRSQRLERGPRAPWQIGKPRTVTTPLRLKGTIDAGTGLMRIKTQDDLQLTETGGRMDVTMNLSAGDELGILVGDMDYPGCGNVIVGRTSPSSNGLTAASAYLRKQQTVESRRAADERREQAVISGRGAEPPVSAPGYTPPAPAGAPVPAPRTASPTRTSPRPSPPDRSLEYVDVTMDPSFASRVDMGVRPIDELFQSFFDRGFKCIGTDTVFWSGNTGTATSALFGTKSYVIECTSNCLGVRYEAAGGARLVTEPGRTHPVITFNAGFFTQTKLNWRFIARSDAATPMIRIHTWSDTWGDYGGGCRIE